MWKFIMMSLLLAAGTAQASVGAVASSTAEAGRASVEATDAAYLNPAVIPYLKGYYFTTGYGSAKNSDSAKSAQFSFSLLDNLPDTVVPTAVAFTQSKNDFTSQETIGNDFRLAFANFIDKFWSGGLGIRYRDDRVNNSKFNQTNMSFSTLYSPTSTWGFAVVLDNVLGESGDSPEGIRLKPTTALGMNYIYKRLIRTRLDLVTSTNNSWDRPLIEAGLEMFMNRWVIMRMGAQRNNEEAANAYSAGLGFVGPHFGIHYAYLMSPEQESLTRHALDLAVPIW